MKVFLRLFHRLKPKVGIQSRSYRSFSEFLPVFKRGADYVALPAVQDYRGEYSYGGLLKASLSLSDDIRELLKGRQGERVAFIVCNDVNLIMIYWAIWMSGQIAVPLTLSHPKEAHDFYLMDSDSNLLLANKEQQELAKEISVRNEVPLHIVNPSLREEAQIQTTDLGDYSELKLDQIGLPNDFYKTSNAAVIYTGGSTETPKGAVFSHLSIHAQAGSLVEAWRLNKRDCFLHALPMQRGPTIMSSLIAPLSVGARVVLLKEFTAEDIWLELLGIRKTPESRPNIFVTRPSVVKNLISVYESKLAKTERMIDHIRTTCSTRIKLMSSGGEPLSKATLNKWEQITGHQMIERFSMSETGMIMANPLHGNRQPGTVGLPLPGIHVRLTSEDGRATIAEGSWTGTRILGVSQPATGHLQVRGKQIFSGYWRKPNKTLEVMTRDGWFKTGDLAFYSRGVYTILGRASTDIFKIGGSVLSTLQIASVIRDHPDILDAAVFFTQTPKGPHVISVVQTKPGSPLSLSELRSWLGETLPPQAIPSEVHFLDTIPKTWVGKHNREAILSRFGIESASMKRFG